MPTLRYHTVDVFTDRAFGGNQLAVVLDADALSQGAMQSVAAEFNYAETSFVRAAAPDRGPTVRIFTPTREMPFAGHPTIGTALVLAHEGRVIPNPADSLSATVTLELPVGPTPVTVGFDGAMPVTATLSAPVPFSRKQEVSVATAAGALGLGERVIVGEHHPPVVIGCGVDFLAVELASAAALAEIRPDAARYATHLGGWPIIGILPYVRDVDGFDTRARMFGPEAGVVEDAATGSANVALAGLLAELEPAADGSFLYRMGQGTEMGRPSVLEGGADKQGGQIITTRIGGAAVPMCAGIIRVPDGL